VERKQRLALSIYTRVRHFFLSGVLADQLAHIYKRSCGFGHGDAGQVWLRLFLVGEEKQIVADAVLLLHCYDLVLLLYGYDVVLLLNY
jgi:hypothetical protein